MRDYDIQGWMSLGNLYDTAGVVQLHDHAQFFATSEERFIFRGIEFQTGGRAPFSRPMKSLAMEFTNPRKREFRKFRMYTDPRIDKILVTCINFQRITVPFLDIFG